MTPDIQQDTVQNVRQTVEDIFQTVCELSPTDRADYLDKACSGDDALRHEIEELLEFHQSHETFLEKPALQDAARRMATRLKISEIEDSTMAEGDWMLGPYRIIDQIGRGGMGVVYLAEDTRDQKHVAIKVLPKDFVRDEDRLARFSREGRMLEELKSLKHPNIAEIFEQAEYDGKPCIALEYVPGDTLAERLRKGPLPISEALQIGLQIMDALESAHQQRIVHRDLKPANIKITPEGQVKILDFGLAKRFQSDPAIEGAGDFSTHSFSLTESGMLIGTPAYMSPEQWNGQQIDQRTDMWAFGCVLYEMLTGLPPFAGKTRAETMKTVLDANPTWQTLPAGTPLVIQSLLFQCFQPVVKQRLQSAGDARRAITEAITDNRFILMLYLKTWIEKINGRRKIWFGKFSQKKKAALIATALILGSSLILLALNYTPLHDRVFRPKKTISLVDKKDLAAILQDAISGMTPELVRAAMMPEMQSSADLLQSKEWTELMVNQENRQIIEAVIDQLKTKVEEDASAKLYAILAQAYLFNFYLTKATKYKDEALQAMQKARSLGAETPETLVVQANTLTAVGEYQEAIEAFMLARKQLSNTPGTPENPDILLGLALAHDLGGDRESLAEGFYKAAIGARSNEDRRRFWMDYDNLGWYYFDRGEYQLAAVAWRNITEINPFSPTGYINLGNAFLYLGCFKEAVKKYEDSISNGGETSEARINLGATYYYLGKYQDSIDNLYRVISREGASEDTNLVEAWGNIADSYVQNDQIDEAKKAYNTALELTNKQLTQFQHDDQMNAIKAELIAKLNALGQNVGQENPIGLIEKTLNPKFACLDCIATAVSVYHLARRDKEALQLARKAVEEGYSPFLLLNNPGLADLSDRSEFKQIQQIAQSMSGNCQGK